MRERVKKLFPFLIPVKRFIWRMCAPSYDLIRAISVSLAPCRTSYSQDGEDRLIMDDTSEAEIQEDIYVDVGGNHPVAISNTYLFYRKGGSGIVIDPNSSFKGLYELFRPRDTFLCIGCGERASIMPFYYHSISSVFNGFTDRTFKVVHKTKQVPVLPLDSILPLIGPKMVYQLSVDVEGMELEVMKSGLKVLERTSRIVVECGDYKHEITTFLEGLGFEVRSGTTHNMILGRAKKEDSSSA